MTTKERNLYLDLVRGFAIVLVVVGHSIQMVYPDTFDDHILFRMIYSFHMPLFMFVSGLLVCYLKTDITAKWLFKKMRMLLIPFIAWIIIPFFFSKNWSEFPSYFLQVLKTPDYGLWFLYILFCCFVLLYVQQILCEKAKVGFRGGTAYYFDYRDSQCCGADIPILWNKSIGMAFHIFLCGFLYSTYKGHS